jgi:hypothetical protein
MQGDHVHRDRQQQALTVMHGARSAQWWLPCSAGRHQP